MASLLPALPVFEQKIDEVRDSIKAHSVELKDLRELADRTPAQTTRFRALKKRVAKDETELKKLYASMTMYIRITLTGGRTAFMIAVVGGHTETAAVLLDHGSNVNHRDAGGMTALMIASFCGHSKLVHLLLERGADVDAVDLEGLTALTYALRGDFAAKLIHGARTQQGQCVQG